MSDRAFLSLRVGEAVPRETLPCREPAAFSRSVSEALSAGRRMVACFGDEPQVGGVVELYVVLADEIQSLLHVGRTRLEADSFASLASQHPQVQLFEREIAEQYGVRAEGHPWFKPVRFQASYRAGRDAWGRKEGERPVVGVMDFFRVEGEEVHEVAVGPVHAGVIEPGHFRFQCHGEQVFHLEISLGYQHRGLERALAGGPDRRTLHTMETVAGDTSVGHATAYCAALEALAGCQVPIRGEVIRGVALELERLANHTGDLGALAGDVAFLPTAAYCGRLRGDFLNLSALLCGNRFGRGLVRPGGAGFDLDAGMTAEALARMESAFRDLAVAAELLWESASVQARFESTGTLSRELAATLGLVGPAARASGLERDIRHDFPSGIFRFAQLPVSVWSTGDVFARAYVRWLEIQRSVAFIREQLQSLPEGPIRQALGPLKPDHFVVTLVEGWRGEICHVALTDAQGRFSRYKLVDPSFHNWMGLALAMRDQQISDFPLCNKSFNLSYCGHDL